MSLKKMLLYVAVFSYTGLAAIAAALEMWLAMTIFFVALFLSFLGIYAHERQGELDAVQTGRSSDNDQGFGGS